MTESDVPEEAAVTSSGETVSQRLVRAREARGLSQKEVADELFLTTTFIRYIDDGDFQKIPKPAFIKGYLRSYARVVGVEPDDLVTAFEQEQNIAPQTPKIVDVTERAEPPAGFSGPVIQTGVIGLVGIIIVGAVVWWIATDDVAEPSVTSVSEPVPQAVEESTLPAEVVEPSPRADGAGEQVPGANAPREDDGDETMAPNADNVVEDTATDDRGEDPDPMMPLATAETEQQSAAPTPDPDPESLAAEDAVVSEAVDVQIERITEDGVNYVTVYAGGDAKMGFEFSDECWVEITDGNGNQVYGDLNRAGDVMTVFGQAPFDVLLGRAPAVEMTVDGEPVDINRFMTRDNTARVRTARL